MSRPIEYDRLRIAEAATKELGLTEHAIATQRESVMRALLAVSDPHEALTLAVTLQCLERIEGALVARVKDAQLAEKVESLTNAD